MWKTNTYYSLKPFVPRSVRMAVRRWIATRRRLKFAASWPISPTAAQPPRNWQGWPGGKQFALVLTHDVERNRGLRRCGQLMDLESRLGFRSSFNFVPEGEYSTPQGLRDRLTDHGFEVGVHDLRHDGKLYRSAEAFKANARQINRYLKEWNAVGFRSAFMLHKLDWLHDLNVLYDASTFDTDPFEPQPDGVDTVFPFQARNKSGGLGYIELPYTLVQDFTLFVLLREPSIDIWKRKAAWVAQCGGMVLLNTHPDYINFADGKPEPNEFDVSRYEQFLLHMLNTYKGAYWHALPCEVARFWTSLPVASREKSVEKKAERI
jgi:hypothetical protein